MRNFIAAVLFIFCNQLYSQQNKYALLIGINQYQKKDSTGKVIIDPKNQLTGCVNDAESIKALLINNFGFQQSNITTLYDLSATRENIFKQLDILKNKCKKGDVAVVYFAGHGMPFRFGTGDADIAEIILPANTFITYPYSYIQQTELAEKFNLFVDKQIVLTTIFDCCFSFGTDRYGPVMVPHTLSPKDSTQANLTPSDNDSDWVEPLELKDANEYNLLANQDDTLIPDTSVLQKSMPNRGLTMEQYREFTKNVKPYGFEKVNITHNPPSQRDNSQFIFLSATNDMEKAPEMRDENGVAHGAFTNALIKVFKTNPINISFKEAFNKIAKQIKEFGKEITPSARYKPDQRENKSMFGIEPQNLKLKVYLPSETNTLKDLNTIYKKWVEPLVKSTPNCVPFNKENAICSKVYIINGGKEIFYVDGKSKKNWKNITSLDTMRKFLKGQPYIIYMPLPKEVNDIIKKECVKNKNIELVDDYKNATISIFCTNYSSVKTINWLSDNVIAIKNKVINNYLDKLSFAGSYETVGINKTTPGHYYSSSDPFISANEKAEDISKKFIDWFYLKAGK